MLPLTKPNLFQQIKCIYSRFRNKFISFRWMSARAMRPDSRNRNKISKHHAIVTIAFGESSITTERMDLKMSFPLFLSMVSWWKLTLRWTVAHLRSVLFSVCFDCIEIDIVHFIALVPLRLDKKRSRKRLLNAWNGRAYRHCCRCCCHWDSVAVIAVLPL